jgi:hypothetical protein
MEEGTGVETRSAAATAAPTEGTLSGVDRERLTFFKWRYVLQADGFPVAQARRLTFMRWLYLQGRLVE